MTAAVRLWRIAVETRTHKANDLSGAGAAKHPGRWNREGEFVVYAAPTLSLAVLETAAHIPSAGLPLDRFVVAIDIPTAEWERREVMDAGRIDPAWCAIPAGRASVELGSAWYRAARLSILMAPSVIVPEEQVAILNASHPGAVRFAATTIRPFSFGALHRDTR